MSKTHRSPLRGMYGHANTRDGTNGPNRGPGRKHKQPLRRADRRRARMNLIRGHYEPVRKTRAWSWMWAMWW